MVKRYSHSPTGSVELDDGEFVPFSDYETLAAEVRQWRLLVNGDADKPFKAAQIACSACGTLNPKHHVPYCPGRENKSEKIKRLGRERDALSTELAETKALWHERSGPARLQAMRIAAMEAREAAARAILEPLADCDPAIRSWLGASAETACDHRWSADTPPGCTCSRCGVVVPKETAGDVSNGHTQTTESGAVIENLYPYQRNPIGSGQTPRLRTFICTCGNPYTAPQGNACPKCYPPKIKGNET